MEKDNEELLVCIIIAVVFFIKYAWKIKLPTMLEGLLALFALLVIVASICYFIDKMEPQVGENKTRRKIIAGCVALIVFGITIKRISGKTTVRQLEKTFNNILVGETRKSNQAKERITKQFVTIIEQEDAKLERYKKMGGKLTTLLKKDEKEMLASNLNATTSITQQLKNGGPRIQLDSGKTPLSSSLKLSSPSAPSTVSSTSSDANLGS